MYTDAHSEVLAKRELFPFYFQKTSNFKWKLLTKNWIVFKTAQVYVKKVPQKHSIVEERPIYKCIFSFCWRLVNIDIYFKILVDLHAPGIYRYRESKLQKFHKYLFVAVA